MKKKNSYYIPNQQTQNSRKESPPFDWIYQLHDAEIISADEKSGTFSICFDCSCGAFTDIFSINFYNYRIIEMPEKIQGMYWISGRIEHRKERYFLESRLERLDGRRPVHTSFSICFQSVSLEYSN